MELSIALCYNLKFTSRELILKRRNFSFLCYKKCFSFEEDVRILSGVNGDSENGFQAPSVTCQAIPFLKKESFW